MGLADLDDDVLSLPADTLALLQEFNAERDARTKHFEDLATSADTPSDAKLSMDAFAEDWNSSQFWYSDPTAHALATALLSGADSSTSIAIVSTPSVYVAIRNILSAQDPDIPQPTVKLFEIDKRFEILGSDFVPYDYQQTFKLPPSLKGSFDRIIVDPPFLSEECQTKMAVTVRYLARDWSKEGLKVVSVTGERMGGVLKRLYGRLGFRETDFEVVHANQLQNDFRCYANFESGEWKVLSERDGEQKRPVASL